MTWQAVEAADILSRKGIEVEVLDLRTLSPMDIPSILVSVRRTRRVVTFEGGWRSCGAGAEICSLISENLLDRLASPPVRLGAEDDSHTHLVCPKDEGVSIQRRFDRIH